ncbi:uncharacterized protein LOC144456911 [Phascolarctos cinereus]
MFGAWGTGPPALCLVLLPRVLAAGVAFGQHILLGVLAGAAHWPPRPGTPPSSSSPRAFLQPLLRARRDCVLSASFSPSQGYWLKLRRARWGPELRASSGVKRPELGVALCAAAFSSSSASSRAFTLELRRERLGLGSELGAALCTSSACGALRRGLLLARRG